MNTDKMLQHEWIFKNMTKGQTQKVSLCMMLFIYMSARDKSVDIEIRLEVAWDWALEQRLNGLRTLTGVVSTF